MDTKLYLRGILMALNWLSGIFEWNDNTLVSTTIYINRSDKNKKITTYSDEHRVSIKTIVKVKNEIIKDILKFAIHHKDYFLSYKQLVLILQKNLL